MRIVNLPPHITETVMRWNGTDTPFQTHITLTAITAATILHTRDAHAVWFASGALMSSLTGESDPLVPSS